MSTPSLRCLRTSSSVACTAIIAPPSGRASMSRARAATSVAASSSDSTPATCAAVSSPTECPATMSGRTPHDSNSRYSATSWAKRAGCVNPVRSRPSPSHITSRNGSPSASTTSSSARANTGNASYSSRPIPARWLPCPENTNAVLPCTGVPPETTVASPLSSSSRSRPTTTARCSNTLRAVASENATSSGDRSSRPARYPASRSACARNAPSPRPDSTHGTTGIGARASSAASC